jgi:amidohydrolase
MTAVIHKVKDEILSDAIGIRQDFHQYPEIAFEEKRTAEKIAQYLRSLGLEVTENIAQTGVMAVLQGARPGKTVALRADMDALPIQEETGLEYASRHEGLMHACGHDGHMAVLLATARLLSEMRQSIAGSVKFIFQPAEEISQGAQEMIAAGVLKNHPLPDAIFSFHARPQIKAGQIELDPIPSAATNGFDIRVIGKACHAAYPHLGVDPIVAGCQIVGALQQIVSRRTSPSEAVVVSVGSFQAGNRRNVIPAEARLQGTIRTRDPDVRKSVVDEVRQVAINCAQAMGAQAEVEIDQGTPRIYNSKQMLEFVRQVGQLVLGKESVLDADVATMGGEDFSYYLLEQGGVPGCMFRLGVETDVAVHTSMFDFGDRALEPGILMMSNIAIEFLSGNKEIVENE